jgi:hypothetical protein
MVLNDDGKLFVFNDEQLKKLWNLCSSFGIVTEGLHGGDMQEQIRLFLIEIKKAFYSEIQLTEGYEKNFSHAARKTSEIII